MATTDLAPEANRTVDMTPEAHIRAAAIDMDRATRMSEPDRSAVLLLASIHASLAVAKRPDIYVSGCACGPKA